MKEEQERTPLRTILQNFLNHVENLDRLSDDSYDKEFQSLKLFSENLKGIKQYSCTEGEKEVNKKKNRYKDILPFDCTRVILSGVASVQGSDYVNANFIKGASGSLAYIASQGPLPHTVNDFWRMVVECEVQVIVMACNEEESGKHKCENYWADIEGEEKHFGMASIRLMKASVVCPDFLVRTMQLKYKKDNTTIERTVCQFHYSAWPDHGVPPLVRPLLDMVRLVRDTQASETLPVLIHCSAGCGRTGTICAIDYVWGLLRAGKLTNDFSLLKLVRDMRKQRIAMVQTKDQYVLVHKAVRELFQEQLKMIDAHPYENVDLNGIPILKEAPMYERVGGNRALDEKQDNKEKEMGRNKSLSKPCEAYTPRSKDKSFVTTTNLTPPLPHKKKHTHIASSKQEKEVENQSQKQRSGITVNAREEVCKNELDNEETHSTTYSSLADSGLSASSSTDSTVTITSEHLPKRCPMPSPSADNVAGTSVEPKASREETHLSSVTSAPSISSLLQKPRIAKLKALFERNSVSKVSKLQIAKPFDEIDSSIVSPKLKTSQQVTRSHSLGAVRKPHKFSQFHSASETPVALYRKFFSTKESKESNAISRKENENDTPKSRHSEDVIATSTSSGSTSVVNHELTKKEKKLAGQSLKNASGSKSSASFQYMTGGNASQNVYHPTPHIQDRRPALPVKRSKSLKVISNVDRSHFSASQNYAVLPSPQSRDKVPFQQQLSSLIGDDFNLQRKQRDANLQPNDCTYSDVYRKDPQVKPIPRERSRKLAEAPSTTDPTTQTSSKNQSTTLSPMPLLEDFALMNGTASHPVPRPRDLSVSKTQVSTQSSTTREALESKHSIENNPKSDLFYSARNKEYVNISEMKTNWHQAGLDSSLLPSSVTANNNKWSNVSSQSTNMPYAQSTFDEAKDMGSANTAEHKVRRSLDEDTRKIVEDCRNYLLVSQDPSNSMCSGHSQNNIGDDMSPSEQFESLSLEAQRKINTIVGGLGIRERRNSFRRAVCRDVDLSNKQNSPKKSLKDYEQIWLQKESSSHGNPHSSKQPVANSAEQTYYTSRSNDVIRDRIIAGVSYIRQDLPQRVDRVDGSMKSSSSISSSSASSSSGGGKRLSEFDGTRPKIPTSMHTSQTYHMLPSANPIKDVRLQQQHLQQLAVAQAQAAVKGAVRSIDTTRKKNNPQLASCKPDTLLMETTSVSNPPAFRREISNLDPIGVGQQNACVHMNMVHGPLAPPRTKRQINTMLTSPQRNSMIEMSEQARIADGKTDPIYANSTCVKMEKDNWHGAPEVDLDTVAASIKQTPPRSECSSESSTPLTRAFERLHSKASNLRTKLSPKSDVDSTLVWNPPSPDTWQQVSGSKVSKSSVSPGSSASKSTPQVTPAKKQQQYL